MKVLVTGANGQLGFALQKTQSIYSAKSALTLLALTRAELDLNKLDTIENTLDELCPDAIINAAAYTAVDKAESDVESAHKVNADAVERIALWCERHKKTLIHVSTDFVFDGLSSSPYSIEANTNPLGVYGQSKWKGEQAAISNCSSAYIVRTGWVYGEHGSNFLKTILRLANERDQLGIVADQIGTPTYATHLAEMIWQLLLQKPQQKIWHFSDAGVASWYDFAVAIVEQAEASSLLKRRPQINPINSSDYPTPARRPAFSVLDKTHTWKALEIPAIHWRDALKICFAYL